MKGNIKSYGVFYYSGTGNSYLVARGISQQLDSNNIYNLLEYKGEYLAYQRIIIVFPVHMYGIPPVVLAFINKIETNNKVKVYAVCTCGGVPGEALWQVKKILKERQMQLAGGYLMMMPRTYIAEFKVQDERKQEQLLKHMEKKVLQIAKEIKEDRENRFEIKEPGFGRVMYRLVYSKAMKDLSNKDSNFWTSSRCISCKKCTHICPNHNIKYEEGKIVWQHNCLMCFRCIHECPKEAIEYGKYTVGRKRYRNLILKDTQWYKQSGVEEIGNIKNSSSDKRAKYEKNT